MARLPVTSDRNPYQRLLYESLDGHGIELAGDGSLHLRWLVTNRRRVDVLHVHWRLDRLARRTEPDPSDPEPSVPASRQVVWLVRLTARLLAARALGYRLVWTVHEPGRITATAFDRGAAWALNRIAHVSVAHDAAAADAVRRLVGGRRPAVVPMGHYAGVYPPAGGRVTRSSLGIDDDAVVFLVFGHIRPDKNVPDVLRAFARLDPTTPAHLLVVGDAHPDVRAELEAGAPDRVHLHLDRIDDERVGDVFAVADWLVLARDRDWTPSSAVLALSLGVPVIAADVPSTTEHLGPGALRFAAGDPDGLAAALRTAAANRDLGPVLGAQGRRHVLSRTWSDTGAALAPLLSGVAGRRTAG